LEALAQDHAFLLAGEVFTEGLIQQWIDYNLEAEY
jgi:glutamine synthetase